MSTTEFSKENQDSKGPTSQQWNDVLRSLDEIKTSVAEVSTRQNSLEFAVFNRPVSTASTTNNGDRDPRVYMFRDPGLLASPVGDPSAEYNSIKSKHSSVRLPQELLLPDCGKQGIKRTDQPMLNVITKSARHVETALKVLKSHDNNAEETLGDVFTVLYSLMTFLQEEQASLVVTSTFNPDVGRFFRALQRGGTFTPTAMENLRSAASIAAVYRPQSTTTTPQRGRGRGFGHRGGGRGDLFQSTSSRSQFPRPSNQGGAGDSSQA